MYPEKSSALEYLRNRLDDERQPNGTMDFMPILIQTMLCHLANLSIK